MPGQILELWEGEGQTSRPQRHLASGREEPCHLPVALRLPRSPATFHVSSGVSHATVFFRTIFLGVSKLRQSVSVTREVVLFVEAINILLQSNMGVDEGIEDAIHFV